MQLCAGRLHQQGDLSKGARTFCAPTRAEDCTQECLAIAAAAARHTGRSNFSRHWETVTMFSTINLNSYLNTHQASGNRCEKVLNQLTTKKNQSFQVDLRIEEIAQDAIWKEEENMGKIREVVGKFKVGYQPKRESDRFDEEESQKIYEQGNTELHELGQISKTVQCNSCLKHQPEGLIFCECGTCLRRFRDDKKAQHQKLRRWLLRTTPQRWIQQRQEAWKSPVAEKDHLESQRCVKSSLEKGLRVNPRGRSLLRITVENWVDRKLLTISGRHLQDRHLLHSNVPAKIKIREHDRPGQQRSLSSWPDAESNGLQVHYKSSCKFTKSRRT